MGSTTAEMSTTSQSSSQSVSQSDNVSKYDERSNQNENTTGNNFCLDDSSCDDSSDDSGDEKDYQKKPSSTRIALDKDRNKFAKKLLVEDKKAVVAFGAFVCLLFSTCIFLIMSLTADAGYLISGVTAGVVFCGSWLGYILFPIVRSLMLLSLPSLCGARGRAVLWCIILGVLMNGPLKNMLTNLNEISRSMSCQGELLYNQTGDFETALDKPFENFADKMKSGLIKLQAVGNEMNALAMPIKAALDKVYGGLVTARSTLDGFSQTCSGAIGKALSKCSETFEETHASCVREIGKVVAGFEKANIFVSNIIKDIGDFFSGRKRRWATIPEGHCVLSRIQRSISVTDVLCAPVAIGGVCDVLEAPNAICKAPGEIAAVIGKAEGFAGRLAAAIDINFNFTLSSEVSRNSSSKQQKSLKQISTSVTQELTGLIDLVNLLVAIFSKLFAATFLLVLLQAFLYRRNFLRKMEYDNIYISSRLVELDNSRTLLGEESVFPLSKDQKEEYIFTNSKRFSKSEQNFLKKGVVSFIIQVMVAVAMFLSDYGLYWFLSILQRYGVDSMIEANVDAKVQFEVARSSGVFADSLLRLVADLNKVSMDYNTSVDFTFCFPQPQATKMSSAFTVTSIYIISFLLLLFQAYGLRLSHKIMEVFHPDIEEERMKFLFNKLKGKSVEIVLEEKPIPVSDGDYDSD